MSRVGAAVQSIAGKLGDEALRNTVSANELKAFVDEGCQGLNASEVAQVKASFEAQLPAFGNDYFRGVFGVSKEALLDALDKKVKSTGGSAGTYFNGLTGANPRTVSDVERFINSPLPGEDRGDLARILEKDRSLSKHGGVAVVELAERLLANAGEIKALLDVFARTGQSAPSKQTVADIKQKLTEESMRPELDVAEVIKEDKWVTAMLKQTGGRVADLASFLVPASRHEPGKLIDMFFNAEGAQEKAENALRMMKELKDSTGGIEMMPLRDLPDDAARLSEDDALHVAMWLVNDTRLESNNGRHTIIARHTDGISSEHIERALELLVGAYDVELRAELIPPAREASFEDAAEFLNGKLAELPSEILDFKRSTAELSPILRIRTKFAVGDEAALEAKTPEIQEAVARMLEANGMSHLVSRNYLGNSMAVTDISGSHGV